MEPQCGLAINKLGSTGDDRRHLPEEPEGRLEAHQLLLLRHLEDVAQVDAGPDEEGRPQGALGARGAGGPARGPLLVEGAAKPSLLR